MGEIVKIGYEITAGVFAVTGVMFCIYYIFLKRRLYIKGASYFVIDADGAGDRLEYYVRRISANIKIDKIILYSGSGSAEALKICEILSRDYPNVEICMKLTNTANNVIII